MRLSIRHTTRYHYDAPVAHGMQRIQLTPKATQGQQIIDWTMEYSGAREELSYDDQNFNHVTLLSVEEGASEVVVTCRGTVDTEDKAGVIGRHSGHLPLWAFLGQTPLTKTGAAVRRLVAQTDKAGGDQVAMLHNLSRTIRDAVEYRTGATQVTTSAEEAAASGAGVCQDHAHIFIAAARSLEIPARYVSGYLMMDDRVEQEATHAWAEAHVQGIGWIGFDISNRISPDARYVRVATGRDYRDAAPLVSLSFGQSAGALSVELAIEQQSIEQ
ncbi:transglutaminase family protein [Erythrobacter sp. EC-HK427]|uniref:transglutaminase family protein n=1 Tax=Erythrobacter sp. EC-HK427 TaxID=2038396 RepID=UPI00125C895D|nr:transglutaminase family protein [Erythrobacter sp. EC-HK427]VVT11648.1 Transglutaminase-like superfamily protein [Erythrobacter sp. EC-HK427]